ERSSTPIPRDGYARWAIVRARGSIPPGRPEIFRSSEAGLALKKHLALPAAFGLRVGSSRGSQRADLRGAVLPLKREDRRVARQCVTATSPVDEGRVRSTAADWSSGARAQQAPLTPFARRFVGVFAARLVGSVRSDLCNS